MGRPGARPLIAALMITASLSGFVLAQHQPRPPARQAPPAPADAAAGRAAAGDRREPLMVGRTAELALAALGQTQTLPLNLAMVTLARSWIGRPYVAFSLDRLGEERLQLDLTRFDCFLFVEQLLALANSGAATPRAALDHFATHVKNLRYQDGRIDYCSRHHYFSLWAQAAERQGYLVNLTPFLPGATSRRRRLNFMSTHADAYLPMQNPRLRSCIRAQEADRVIEQSYLPLDQLEKALPSLRNGDLFGLVTRVDGLDVTHVGVVERLDGRLDAVHAAPGNGVMRSVNLARYARNVPDVIGLMILRPMPKTAAAPDGGGSRGG